MLGVKSISRPALVSPEIIIGLSIDDLDGGPGQGCDGVVDAVLHPSVDIPDVEFFEAEILAPVFNV